MLTEPKNALLKQYSPPFALDDLVLDDAAIAAIARPPPNAAPVFAACAP